MAGSWKIGTLRAFLNADSTQFDRTMVHAQRMAKTTGGRIGAVFSRFAAKFGTAATFAGVVYAVGRVVKSLDDLAERADAVGIKADIFQRWEYAAKRTGIGVDSVISSVQRMREIIGDAGQNPSGASADLLSQLGLTFGELKDLSPEKQFDAVAEALRKVESETIRAALQMKIYGRASREMNGFLRDYNRLMSEAPVINAPALEGAAKVADLIDDVKANLFQLVSESGLVEFLGNAADRAQSMADAIKSVEKSSRSGVFSWRQPFAKAGIGGIGNAPGRLTYAEAEKSLSDKFQVSQFGRVLSGSEIKKTVYEKAGVSASSYLSDLSKSGILVAESNRRARDEALAQYNAGRHEFLRAELVKLGFFGSGGGGAKRQFDWVDRPDNWDGEFGGPAGAASGAPAVAQSVADAVADAVADPLERVGALLGAESSDPERVARWRAGLAAGESENSRAAMASLAGQGSADAYRLIANQTRDLVSPMKRTADSAKSIERAVEIIAENTKPQNTPRLELDIASIEGE